MAKLAIEELPAAVAGVRARFDRWRSARTTRAIPDELWSAAAALALDYGPGYTARALGLGYDPLKRRMEAAGAAAMAPVFVDAQAPVVIDGPACTAELTHPGGTRMRIEWRGDAGGDLAALIRGFLGSAP